MTQPSTAGRPSACTRVTKIAEVINTAPDEGAFGRVGILGVSLRRGPDAGFAAGVVGRAADSEIG